MKLMDGAMSSYLSKNTPIQSPIWGSEYLLTDKDQVKQAHKDYLYAGSGKSFSS